MKERRRSPRYAVQDLRGVVQFSVEARLLDVSLTGAALELAAPIRVGKTYGLKLRGGGSVVRMSGTGVWCRPAAGRPGERSQAPALYHAGLRFDDVLDPRAEQVLAMVRDSAVVSFGRRVSARFRLETPRPVDVHAEHQFEVRKLSASGMLIETDLGAELDSIVEVDLQLDGAPLRTRGRIAYIVADSGGGEAGAGVHYRLGVEFTRLSAANRRRLEAFLAQQGEGD
jgi:hypothetical protein